ncbi:MAG: glycerol-3-phosphate transporter permease, partial [Pararhodobacter sp.]
MQTKRTTFSNLWLPYLLLAPQVAVTLVFFIWPAWQALLQSVYRQGDAFGIRPPTFVGLRNFAALFQDSLYLNSMKVTLIFS